MKKVLIASILCFFFSITCLSFVVAQNEDNDFYIVPKSEKDMTDTVKRIGNSGGEVWKAYKEESYEIGGSDKKNPDSLGKQFSSGVFSWDSIIDFLVDMLRFVAQVSLIVGAGMFIYNGYLYASYAFTNKKPEKQKIYYAIGGILIIIFSYAIMRILQNAFL